MMMTDNATGGNVVTEDEVDSNWRRFSLKGRPKSTISNQPQLKVENEDQVHYRMGRKGRCLVLNYEKFAIFEKPRSGTKADVKILKKTFEGFGFEVEVFQDLSVVQTKRILFEESSLDHSSYDCFILCILSHGENNFIYCSDDSLPISYLFNQFTKSKCPSLAGKPKLFFIQACRGDLFDSGTLVHDGPSSFLEDAEDDAFFVLPNEVDFLVCYSTYPEFVSWRNKSDGSWFMQELCSIVAKYYTQMDLMSMLALVAQQIAFNRQSMSEEEKTNRKKQIPCLMTTLTRLIRLDKD